MKYQVEFKPKSVRDIKPLPKNDAERVLKKIEQMRNEFLKIQEELADYEDLHILREAKLKEDNAPTISLTDLKKELNIE